MVLKRLWTMLLCLLSISYTGGATHSQLLLISMDGFRWDYIDKTETPNFDKFIKEGVRVRQVQSVFSTATFPNHWTLVTGLYEEDTGIVANTMYDPVFNKTFDHGTESEWFNDTEPIWVTAVRENLTSGAYMWVGNEATINGRQATKVVRFHHDSDDKSAVDLVVDEWLAREGLDFSCLYFTEPDRSGHDYGPNSEEVKKAIKKMDSLVGYLMDKLDAKNMTDKVNVIIAADHGMAEGSPDRVINLNQYVNFKEDVEWSYISIIAHILPKENRTEKVYNALKAANESHMQVFLKEDIPDNLFYKKHRRIQPIFLLADEGWVMTKSKKVGSKGEHGYNNTLDSMKSMFVARGPDFKCGYQQDSLQIIDIYPLLCDLLGLKTCHSGPGSLDKTMKLRTTDQNCLTEPVIPTTSPGSTTAGAVATTATTPALIFLLVAINYYQLH